MRQLKGPGIVNAGSMASLTGTLRQTDVTTLDFHAIRSQNVLCENSG